MPLGRITTRQRDQMRLLLPAEETPRSGAGAFGKCQVYPFLDTPPAGALHRGRPHLQHRRDFLVGRPALRLEQDLRPQQLARRDRPLPAQPLQRRPLLLRQMHHILLGHHCLPARCASRRGLLAVPLPCLFLLLAPLCSQHPRARLTCQNHRGQVLDIRAARAAPWRSDRWERGPALPADS